MTMGVNQNWSSSVCWDKHTVFVRTSSSIKSSLMMSQSYFTINVAHVHEQNNVSNTSNSIVILVSASVQEILELHDYKLTCKLKLNILTSSSVRLLNLSQKYTGFLLIIILNFLKFCANISFVVNDGSI